MKRFAILLLVVVLVFSVILGACTKKEPVESLEPTDDRGEFYWYGPNYPDLMGPTLGEDLSYFDWGTLLPEEEEVLIDSGDGWAVYKRGDFDSGSILFALADRGIHHPDWSDRSEETV